MRRLVFNPHCVFTDPYLNLLPNTFAATIRMPKEGKAGGIRLIIFSTQTGGMTDDDSVTCIDR
jgi:hypothetical protein